MFAAVLIPHFHLSVALRADPARAAQRLRLCVLAPDEAQVLDAAPALLQAGVRPGQAPREALGLYPDLCFVTQTRGDVDRLMGELIDLLHEHSPDLEIQGAGELLIDLGAEETEALRLEGQQILQAIQKRFLMRGKLGLAPSRLVARLAAQDARSGEVILVSPGETVAFMGAQALTVLPLAPRLLERLERVGIRHVAQLAELGPKQLTRLCGEDATELMGWLEGRDQRPFEALAHEDMLTERVEADAVLFDQAALLRLVETALKRLFAQMKQRHKLCVELAVCLGVENGEDATLRVRFASPLNSVSRAQRLIAERLSGLQLDAGIERVEVQLHGLVAEYAQQLDLMDGSAAKLQRKERLKRVRERLEQREEQGGLMTVVQVDMHDRLPERRAYLQDMVQQKVRRGLCLPRPIQLAVNEEGTPYLVKLRSGWFGVERSLQSWELEDEWWNMRPILRAYQRLYLVNGAILRVFRDRVNGCWYQQGR